MMAQSAPNPTREELDVFTLRRAARGEQDACRALFARYQAPVYSTLTRFLNDPGRIEDLSQETFLRVFQNLSTFDIKGPARLSTWILTIALNLCRDEARKQKRRAHHDTTLSPLHSTKHLSEVEQTLDAKASLKRVDGAIRNLPSDQREALVLCVYGELSAQEAALALNTQTGTVKSRVSRAKAALKKRLSPQQHEDAS